MKPRFWLGLTMLARVVIVTALLYLSRGWVQGLVGVLAVLELANRELLKRIARSTVIAFYARPDAARR